MNMCVTIIPAALSLVIGLIYLFGFNMSDKQHDEIKKELEQKRAAIQ